jgi:hypothetical protein
VVLDPRFRGAGLMGDPLSVALRRMKPVRYCEALMAMGAVTGYWRAAGFRDCGPTLGSNQIKAGWAFRGPLRGGRPARAASRRQAERLGRGQRLQQVTAAVGAEPDSVLPDRPSDGPR